MDKYVCKICGNIFYRSPWHKRVRKGAKCCSRKCANIFYKSKHLHSWNYKGGKTTSRGYKIIHLGNNIYKFEHRIIMEKILKRPLKSHEAVHHLNGIKNDNRPENLIVMFKNFHDAQGKTYILKLQERIRHLENLLHQAV